MEQGQIIDEAVERAGIDPTSLTHRHLDSINTSLKLLFTFIEKKMDAEYRMLETTISIPLNAKAVELPSNTIDVADVMIVKSNGEEIPTRRISRQDYLNVNRSPQLVAPVGTPSGWWVSKSLPGEVARLPDGSDATDNMLLVLWPAMGESGASARVSYIRETIDPGFLGDTVDARRQWWDTIAEGLGARVAQKYNFPRYKGLQTSFLGMLSDQSEDRHPVIVGFRGHGWSRTRRH